MMQMLGDVLTFQDVHVLLDEILRSIGPRRNLEMWQIRVNRSEDRRIREELGNAFIR